MRNAMVFEANRDGYGIDQIADGAMTTVEKLRAAGYPLRIKGNDGYSATLVGVQPLLDGDYEALYRYPGGICVHSLEEINMHFEIIER